MSDRADEIARSICTNLTSAGALEGADPYAERMVLDAIIAYGDERAKGERERYTDILKYAQSLADEEFGQEVSANDISRLADAIRALKEEKP